MRVPFGRRSQVGLVVAHARHAEVADAQLRHIHEPLDAEPLLPASVLELLRRAADYYHAPPGEVLVGTLPGLLRAGRPARPVQVWQWSLTAAAPSPDSLSRAPRQAALLGALAQGPCEESQLDAALPGWRVTARTLADKGWIERAQIAPDAATDWTPERGHPLTTAQRAAVDALAASSGFGAFLLDGVTGSGKTEVYLTAIEAGARRRSAGAGAGAGNQPHAADRGALSGALRPLPWRCCTRAFPTASAWPPGWPPAAARPGC